MTANQKTETNECREAFKKHANKIGLDAREREDGTFMTNQAEAAFGYFSAGAAWNRPAATAEVGSEGFTGDEIRQLARQHSDTTMSNGLDIIGFARAIERALNHRMAGNAGKDLIGTEVSLDVSTGDESAGHRIFGRVFAVQDGILLAEETSRNFTTQSDQQAKDAALLRELLRESQTAVCGSGNSDLCGRIAEALHSTRHMKHAAFSTTNQEEV